MEERPSQTVAYLSLGAAVTAVLLTLADATVQDHGIVQRALLWAGVAVGVVTFAGFVYVGVDLVQAGRRRRARERQWCKVEVPGWTVTVVRARPRSPEGAWADARPEIRVRKTDGTVPDERLRIGVVAPGRSTAWAGRWSDPVRMAQPTGHAHAAFPDDFGPKPVGPLPDGSYEARVVVEREDEQTGEVTKLLAARTLFELTPDERFRAGPA